MSSSDLLEVKKKDLQHHSSLKHIFLKKLEPVDAQMEQAKSVDPEFCNSPFKIKKNIDEIDLEEIEFEKSPSKTIEASKNESKADEVEKSKADDKNLQKIKDKMARMKQVYEKRIKTQREDFEENELNLIEEYENRLDDVKISLVNLKQELKMAKAENESGQNLSENIVREILYSIKSKIGYIDISEDASHQASDQFHKLYESTQIIPICDLSYMTPIRPQARYKQFDDSLLPDGLNSIFGSQRKIQKRNDEYFPLTYKIDSLILRRKNSAFSLLKISGIYDKIRNSTTDVTQDTRANPRYSSGMDAYKLFNKGEFIDKFVNTIHTRFKSFAMWKLKIKQFEENHCSKLIKTGIDHVQNLDTLDNIFKRHLRKRINSTFFELKLSYVKKAYIDKEITDIQNNKKLVELFDDVAVQKILHYIVVNNKMDVHEAIGLLRERPHSTKHFAKLSGAKSKIIDKKTGSKNRGTILAYKKNGISVAFMTIYKINSYYYRKLKKAMTTLKIHKQKNVSPSIRVGMTTLMKQFASKKLEIRQNATDQWKNVIESWKKVERNYNKTISRFIVAIKRRLFGDEGLQSLAFGGLREYNQDTKVFNNRVQKLEKMTQKKQKGHKIFAYKQISNLSKFQKLSQLRMKFTLKCNVKSREKSWKTEAWASFLYNSNYEKSKNPNLVRGIKTLNRLFLIYKNKGYKKIMAEYIDVLKNDNEEAFDNMLEEQNVKFFSGLSEKIISKQILIETTRAFNKILMPNDFESQITSSLRPYENNKSDKDIKLYEKKKSDKDIKLYEKNKSNKDIELYENKKIDEDTITLDFNNSKRSITITRPKEPKMHERKHSVDLLTQSSVSKQSYTPSKTTENNITRLISNSVKSINPLINLKGSAKKVSANFGGNQISMKKLGSATKIHKKSDDDC